MYLIIVIIYYIGNGTFETSPHTILTVCPVHLVGQLIDLVFQNLSQVKTFLQALLELVLALKSLSGLFIPLANGFVEDGEGKILQLL